jgi:hypothetical protein
MLNKPTKQGYKIFALAENGYVWYFQLSLKQHGIGELHKVNELTRTGSIVLQMARLLSKFPNVHYVLYLDNCFTSIHLFSMLWKENIGAVGVTIRHMYAATPALAPDYGGSTSPTSKGQASNVYIRDNCPPKGSLLLSLA